MSVDSVLYSAAYISAWNKFAATGWNPSTLTDDERRALSEDLHTKTWMEELRTAAPASKSHEKTIASEMVLAIKAMVSPDGDNGRAFTALVTKYAGAKKELSPVAPIALACAVRALAAEMVALKARPHLEHRGTWSGLESYPAASLVTCKGGLWLSMQATTLGQRPGDGASPWKLIVKSGDAR